jgi:hypothetical protein
MMSMAALMRPSQVICSSVGIAGGCGDLVKKELAVRETAKATARCLWVPQHPLSAEIGIQEIYVGAFALDPRPSRVAATIPDRERGLSICSVLVAISALVSDFIETDDQTGCEVELLYCTHLLMANAEVGVTTGRKHLRLPDSDRVLRTGRVRSLGKDGRHLHIVTERSFLQDGQPIGG